MTEPIHIDDLVPADWQGKCICCHCPLTVEDFRKQRVVASVPKHGVLIVCCAGHFQQGSGKDWGKAMNSLAAETARILNQRQ